MAILAHQIDAHNNLSFAPNTFAREMLRFQREQFEQFEQVHDDSPMSAGRTTRVFKENIAIARVWRSFIAIENIAFCKSCARGSVWN